MILTCKACDNNELELLGEYRIDMGFVLVAAIVMQCHKCGGTTVFHGAVDTETFNNPSPLVVPYDTLN